MYECTHHIHTYMYVVHLYKLLRPWLTFLWLVKRNRLAMKREATITIQMFMRPIFTHSTTHNDFLNEIKLLVLHKGNALQKGVYIHIYTVNIFLKLNNSATFEAVLFHLR